MPFPIYEYYAVELFQTLQCTATCPDWRNEGYNNCVYCPDIKRVLKIVQRLLYIQDYKVLNVLNAISYRNNTPNTWEYCIRAASHWPGGWQISAIISRPGSDLRQRAQTGRLSWGQKGALALACYPPKWVPLYELMKQRVLCRSSFADRGPKTAETANKYRSRLGGYRLHSRPRPGICQIPYRNMCSKNKKIDLKNA